MVSLSQASGFNVFASADRDGSNKFAMLLIEISPKGGLSLIKEKCKRFPGALKGNKSKTLKSLGS